MHRFFFHVADGTVSPDQEGVELPSETDARLEAIRSLGEMLRDEPKSFLSHTHLTLTVADQAGRPLFGVEVKAVEPRDTMPS